MDIFEILAILAILAIAAIIIAFIFAVWSEVSRKKALQRKLDHLGEQIQEEIRGVSEDSNTKALDAHIESMDELIDELVHDVKHEGGKVGQLQSQVNHLAKVQMLVLKQLNVEHQVLPERDVLVTIGDLSDLKKTKGRSA